MLKLGIERSRATVVPSGGERLDFDFEISPHAAGVELERWDLEHVVEMTEAFMRRKEDAEFEALLPQ